MCLVIGSGDFIPFPHVIEGYFENGYLLNGCFTVLHLGLHRISGIRPDIRFRLPDIRLEKTGLNQKQKTNKITTKNIPERLSVQEVWAHFI